MSVFTRLVIPDLAQAEAATERLTSPSLGTFFFSYLDGVFPVETVQDVSAPLITPFEAPSPPPPSELDPTGENIFTGDGTLNGRILIGLIIGGVIALLACYALYLCRMTCRRHPKKSTEEEPVRLRDSKASAPNGRQTSKDSTPDERKPLSSLVLTVLSFLSCYILYFCFMIRRRTAKKGTKEGPVERDSFASLDEQSSWFEPRTSYPPSTATHTQAEENVNTPIVVEPASPDAGLITSAFTPRTESALADGTLTQGMEEGRNREIDTASVSPPPDAGASSHDNDAAGQLLGDKASHLDVPDDTTRGELKDVRAMQSSVPPTKNSRPSRAKPSHLYLAGRRSVSRVVDVRPALSDAALDPAGSYKHAMASAQNFMSRNSSVISSASACSFGESSTRATDPAACSTLVVSTSKSVLDTVAKANEADASETSTDDDAEVVEVTVASTASLGRHRSTMINPEAVVIDDPVNDSNYSALPPPQPLLIEVDALNEPPTTFDDTVGDEDARTVRSPIREEEDEALRI